jgi:hypothetical protein
MENDFEIYGDRDENHTILLCRKTTLIGAVAAGAEFAEFWDKIVIYKNEMRVASITLNGHA